MGLENIEHANYLTIGNGKICKEVKNPTEKSVQRTNKNNRIVHEEFYDKVSGVLTGIETRENDYGKQWIVTLNDNGEVFKLQMSYSSGYSSAFLKALPNVDLSRRVSLIPKMTVEGDKKKTSLFLSQNGEALKWYYTKENPNDLPPMTQKKVKGKLTWDDSEMMEFLESMVNRDILPKLKGVTKSESAEVSEQSDEDLF